MDNFIASVFFIMAFGALIPFIWKFSKVIANSYEDMFNDIKGLKL